MVKIHPIKCSGTPHRVGARLEETEFHRKRAEEHQQETREQLCKMERDLAKVRRAIGDRQWQEITAEGENA